MFRLCVQGVSLVLRSIVCYCRKNGGEPLHPPEPPLYPRILIPASRFVSLYFCDPASLLRRFRFDAGLFPHLSMLPFHQKEGKFSFPIIHCVRAKPGDHRLLNILKQRTEDVDVKKHALLWMKQAVRDEQRARGTSANTFGAAAEMQQEFGTLQIDRRKNAATGRVLNHTRASQKLVRALPEHGRYRRQLIAVF